MYLLMLMVSCKIINGVLRSDKCFSQPVPYCFFDYQCCHIVILQKIVLKTDVQA